MVEHREITTLAEFDALDANECRQGYLDAERGDPEPGDNHTRSYWHGWRMRQNDVGAIPISDAHHKLVLAVLMRRQASRADDFLGGAP